MAASIYDWSITAGNNATADADINWSEGMFPSVVNDSARQMMGRLAEYVGDNGIRIAAGTANAITLTTNAAITVPPQGMTVAFKALASNTGAVTLGLNGGGGRRLRKIFAGNTDAVDLDAADITAKGVYIAHYDPAANSGAGAWILINPTNSKEIQKVADNYVKKSGDTMTGPLTATSLTSTGGVSGVIQHRGDYLTIGSYAIPAYGDGFVRAWWNENGGELTFDPGTSGKAVTLRTHILYLRNTTPTSNYHATSKIYVDNEIAKQVAKSGDTMTGLLTLSGAPTAALHAATKAYVDTLINQQVSKSGDTMTGNLNLPNLYSTGAVQGALSHTNGGGYMTIGSFSTSAYGSGYGRLWWNEDERILTLSSVSAGDATFSTNYVLVNRDPTSGSHATRKSYVDNWLNTKLNANGGNATNLTLGTYPTSGNQAASKSYVDNQIATCVTDTRWSAESYSGTIPNSSTWRADAGAAVTGLQIAANFSAIGAYSKTLQIQINGSWRNAA